MGMYRTPAGPAGGSPAGGPGAALVDGWIGFTKLILEFRQH